MGFRFRTLEERIGEPIALPTSNIILIVYNILCVILSLFSSGPILLFCILFQNCSVDALSSLLAAVFLSIVLALLGII
eukprot:Pgem_evm1s8710